MTSSPGFVTAPSEMAMAEEAPDVIYMFCGLASTPFAFAMCAAMAARTAGSPGEGVYSCTFTGSSPRMSRKAAFTCGGAGTLGLPML